MDDENRSGKWETFEHTLTIRGYYLKLKRPMKGELPPRGRKRKEIVALSRSSRRRLLEVIASLDKRKNNPAILATVTYPDEALPLDDRAGKRHLDLLARGMERNLSQLVPMIWRKEWQVRKSGKFQGCTVPHYHLLAFKVRFLDWRVLRALWAGVIGAEGAIATDVRRVPNVGRAGRYLGKYLAKVEPYCSLDHVAYRGTIGRSWGLRRKGEIALAPLVYVDHLSPLQELMVQHVAEKHAAFVKELRTSSFTLLGPAASEVERQIFADFACEGNPVQVS